MSKNAASGGPTIQRISNSFTDDEIIIMEFILMILLRGGDPTMARRHRAYAGLCRKVQGMKKRVEEKRKAPLPRLDFILPPAPGPNGAAHAAEDESEAAEATDE